MKGYGESIGSSAQIFLLSVQGTKIAVLPDFLEFDPAAERGRIPQVVHHAGGSIPRELRFCHGRLLFQVGRH